MTIKVKFKSKFKDFCFTGGLKVQYIMNTITDAKINWSNQIITQTNINMHALFELICDADFSD